MKNYEKYKDKILNYNGNDFCHDFIKAVFPKRIDCELMECEQCQTLRQIWLMEEYEEPEIDWSKVAVDTPILVREYEDDPWHKRHFAKYEGGKVHAWSDGCTSWSARNTFLWKYAKLAEVEEENETNKSSTIKR